MLMPFSTSSWTWLPSRGTLATCCIALGSCTTPRRSWTTWGDEIRPAFGFAKRKRSATRGWKWSAWLWLTSPYTRPAKGSCPLTNRWYSSGGSAS